eukprot:3113324-Rhodomonas_salina.1
MAKVHSLVGYYTAPTYYCIHALVSLSCTSINIMLWLSYAISSKDLRSSMTPTYGTELCCAMLCYAQKLPSYAISGTDRYPQIRTATTEYFQSFRRHVYVTPKSYLSFLKTYCIVYNQQYSAIKELADKINNGPLLVFGY